MNRCLKKEYMANMTIKYLKTYFTLYVSREQQIKITWHHYIPLRMANIQSKNWLYKMFLRIWNSRSTQSLLIEIQNCTAYLEDNFTVSYKTKYHTKQSSNNPSIYLTNWVETSSHPNLDVNVCSNIIYSCQRLEATKLSFNRWMGK